MINRTVTFYGSNRDQFGMPNPFYRYLIIENEAPWLGDSHYIASILSLTDSSPMPKKRNFLSDQGVEKALELAVNALKSLSQMKSLNMYQS